MENNSDVLSRGEIFTTFIDDENSMHNSSIYIYIYIVDGFYCNPMYFATAIIIRIFDRVHHSVKMMRCNETTRVKRR
jgi:hypothetical protein